MSSQTVFTYKTGLDLKAFITPDHKFKIVVKSKEYNKNGAYWPLETSYVEIGSEIYNELTKNDDLVRLFVKYYNEVKLNYHKHVFNMPNEITEDLIDSIVVHKVPLSYQEYFR